MIVLVLEDKSSGQLPRACISMQRDAGPFSFLLVVGIDLFVLRESFRNRLPRFYRF
jgi:hypothetical protein